MMVSMWDTPGRLLRLLALLQRRRDWNAEQLAEELDVTPRTVRRDIGRLRELGYPVTTVLGAGGGYQLEAGATLPPLMFDTDEAIAVMVSLRDMVANTAAGTAEGALSAFVKLHRVMPPRLQPVVEAFLAHTSSLDLGTAIGPSAGPVNITTLVLLARACRDRRQLLCRYRRYSGEIGNRQLEPLHLVHTMGHWYLLAYSLESSGWRTFRVDRLSETQITNKPSYPRQPPAEDLHEYVTAQLAAGWRQVTGTVRVHAPRAQVDAWIRPAWGTVTEETANTCIVNAGADSYQAMARWLLLIGARLTILEPAELRTAFTDLAAEIARIADDNPAEERAI
ncbi:YafY family transcriptional regulator [Cryobacterium mannosilyticum]|uniref:YafY family transcriptional regulator n=2 Tax=Cryobacterium mannosilyticum TaxID=1259190 RepID=A0A4R8W767_9MICO|nr:YafY family transcriptional regulator [Cryobacterium mannosilyticum]